MTNFLIYDAKVAVLIIVFYMFYRLMLSRETFHRVNRVVLQLTAIASFVLPLSSSSSSSAKKSMFRSISRTGRKMQ